MSEPLFIHLEPRAPFGGAVEKNRDLGIKKAPADYPWATGIQASDQQHGFKQLEAT